MFDFWPVYSGEQFRASWPSCYDFIQVFVFTKNHHLQHVRYLHVHGCSYTHFAVPTASARHMHIRSRTTYDRHYNDNADAVTQQIRELGYKLGAEALRKYYDKATGEGSYTRLNLLLFLSNSL